MPLGSWIGSNQGLRTRDAVRIIIEQATVPVVVDAGLGAPSHAAEAMEMGVDAVLVNTAIAVARDPVGMAEAFRLGVEAGRRAFLAGRYGGHRTVTDVSHFGRGGEGVRGAGHPAERHGDGFVEPAPQVTYADELDRLPFASLLATADAAS